MSMTKNVLGATALAAVLALAAPAGAQGQLALELRGSINNPMGDFGDDEQLGASSEAGLGGDVIYSLSPNLSVYGGYEQQMFGCEGCGDDDGATSSGFQGGAKLIAYRDGLLPWLKAGVVGRKLQLEEDGFEVESDTGVGFQVAAGVDIPLGDVLWFSPGVRYEAYDAEFDVAGDFVTTEQAVQFLALDLGLHIHLGQLSN